MAWTWLLSIMDNRRKKMYEKDLPSFLDLLAPLKDERILDVGAGLGAIADVVTSSCDEVFALEPEEGKVEYMKDKHPQVKSFIGTAAQIPFPTSYFNKLYAIVSFHHFPDQGDALDEFRRVVRKNGNLLIQEIDPSHKSGRVLNFFETRIVRRKATFLTPEKLRNLVELHNFKVVKERAGSRGYFLLAKNEKDSDESDGWIDTSSLKQLF